MLSEIFKRTPPWVFVLFFALVLLGYFQSRPTTVRRRVLLVLPAVFLVWSLYGVVSVFGLSATGVVFWGLGVLLAVGLGGALGAPRGVTYFSQTQSFAVPGSWVPLACMMAIFLTRYAVAVVLARQLALAQEVEFVGTVGFCYGLLSGVFLARAIVIRRAANVRVLTRSAH